MVSDIIGGSAVYRNGCRGRDDNIISALISDLYACELDLILSLAGNEDRYFRLQPRTGDLPYRLLPQKSAVESDLVLFRSEL